ncbi:DMT family transporter [Pontibacillus yanchengensis]|uniref:Transporter n=1 Tax=Pontibacillus yanchengensis Y32 TaxID=1385514 RepID=A0A0A2TA22_9BACI|nr:DMT family transporter [Pontibacillus yanchengensis]KGP71263.1 transporter [Pontibacillus yanchengensis Y32]
MNQKTASISIAVGATLWGIIGLFVTYLYEMGFTPLQVVAMRVLSSLLFLLVYVLYKDRRLLHIRLSDSKLFVGTGVISIVFFNWCLFSAMGETSMSIAFILLYTAPAFVTIFSRLLFKEWLTKRKMIALVMTVVGCAFVIGLLPNAIEPISMYGFLLGIGSGIFYALYSIFGKFALQKYDSLTVTFYTFLFATVAVLPSSGIWSELALLRNAEVWLYIVGLGFLSTTLPFLFYTKGLSAVESSRASIIATIEPVVASLVGLLVFQERLTLWQYGGIVLVLAAVMIVQETKRNKAKVPRPDIQLQHERG